MVDAQYYSPQEVAAVLGCDDEQVLHWIHSGQLPASNVAKSPNGLRPRWRIAEADLGRFLLSRRNARSLIEDKPSRGFPKVGKQYV